MNLILSVKTQKFSCDLSLMNLIPQASKRMKFHLFYCLPDN